MSYTLQITLNNRTPANERTIEINDSATFVDLANAICTLYGFDGEHLWEFIQKHKLCINHPEISIDAPIDTDIFGEDEALNDPELLEVGDNTLQVSATTYTLDQFFSTEKEIIFAYDFLAGWQFTITKKAEDKKTNSETERTVLSGKWTYLIEDSGGPGELKAQLATYKKKEFDDEARETFEDFAEWIEPALKEFTAEG
jgi:hypothetical protein